MKKPSVLVTAAAAAIMIAPAAQASYLLSYTGTDGVSFTDNLIDLTGGHVGFPGSTTDQTWGGGNLTSFGGWLDFNPSGESFGLEGGTPSGGSSLLRYFYAASNPFYSLTGNLPGHFDLSFPGLLPGHSEMISVTNVAVNDGVDNINFGDVGTLTITYMPEPAGWTLLLVGATGIGVAMRTRRKAEIRGA